MVSGAALGRACLLAHTARAGACGPLAQIPLRLLPARGLRSDRLVAILGRRNRDVPGIACTIGGRLTYHVALRMGTLQRLFAIPVADWIGTDSLASHTTAAHRGTIHGAFGLIATCTALGRFAVQSLLTLAWVFWAKHGTVRFSTIDLAPLECIRRAKLRATCLTLRNRAIRLAILLANRIGTIPSAMGNTAHSLVHRDHRCARLQLLGLATSTMVGLYGNHRHSTTR
mmetsp:Transcript_34604/g.83516  ORF Transcript_34604/g.83516 Transcript_34604/m.83516 type:complete len:228 (+) Transcript_34604:736-1419(+)